MDGLVLSCTGFDLSGKTFDYFEEAVHVPSLRRRGSAHRFRLGAVVEPHVAERHDPDFGSESFVGQGLCPSDEVGDLWGVGIALPVEGNFPAAGESNALDGCASDLPDPVAMGLRFPLEAIGILEDAPFGRVVLPPIGLGPDAPHYLG